jgi:hypothetical protein
VFGPEPEPFPGGTQIDQCEFVGSRKEVGVDGANELLVVVLS